VEQHIIKTLLNTLGGYPLNFPAGSDLNLLLLKPLQEAFPAWLGSPQTHAAMIAHKPKQGAVSRTAARTYAIMLKAMQTDGPWLAQTAQPAYGMQAPHYHNSFFDSVVHTLASLLTCTKTMEL
jgi:hypothetical protein